MHKICSLNLLHDSRRRPHHHQQYRRLYEALSSLNCVRDRGLDHALEREKYLKPLLNIKNLIKSEPSKSLPLNLITQAKESLHVPTRPIEFIRKFPSFFQEFLPGGIGISPHIKLTPSVINLDKEEDIVYQSVDYKQDAATRLLKLLMISRINKIPLEIIDMLKWELGLPQDYVNTIVPEFPDYFRVIDGRALDLVCWNSEVAVSVMEKKGKEKIQFPLIHSSGFEMDKKYKSWVEEWQKLPYTSPYENAKHLASKSDESDKWSVGVLHEVMNLFVGKKAEWDSVLVLGECLGIRPRFKLSLLQHPGIFYLSYKIGTPMVVLKEGYKRGMLIKTHPVREMRHKYVKLMNIGKKEQDSKCDHQKSNKDLKEEHKDAERETGKMNHDHEEDDDKDESNFQKGRRNSRERLTRTNGGEWRNDDKDENNVPKGRRNSRERLTRTNGGEWRNDDKDENNVQKDRRNSRERLTRTNNEGEWRRPQRMRGSKTEVNSFGRARLKTETPASKNFMGNHQIVRTGPKRRGPHPKERAFQH